MGKEALLGQKYPTTTARYAHLSPDPLRAANEVVGMRLAAAMNCTSISKFKRPISRGGPHSLAAHAVKLVSASIRYLIE